jgi:DNA-binding NarL/FixJ family response regulator
METQTHKTTVVLVDDHAIARLGLRAALESDPRINVVAEAATGEQAVTMARLHAPDVLLCDVHLPGQSGIEVARAVKLHLPRTATVLMTGIDDEELLFEAIKIGAAAFLTKDARPEDLCDAVVRAGHGEYLINESVLVRPLVAARVLKQFRSLPDASPEAGPLFVPLSPREIEVLDYIARGNANKEVARALGISDQTVKNHVTSILRKLNVNDRTQAVVYALRRGWIAMPQG